jgi:3-phosphoshikimate 1-carboxyvinyltransferase
MNKIAYIYPLEHPIDVKVTVPGSKSFTNRALIIAALANGTTTLHGVSNANDSAVLTRLLQKIGVEMQVKGDTISIKGTGGKFSPFNGELDVEDAGTVMRFLSALCCIIPGDIALKGSVRMHQRPIKGLVDGLRQLLGAKVTYTEDEGYPPIKINGGNCKGGIIHVDASLSSQFVSALLMVSPLLSGNTEIVCDGELASVPYVDMTISVMKHFGVVVRHENHKHYYVKSGQAYKATEYKIEGDASSASYMFALAALSGSTVEVTNVSAQSLQSDAAFADILGKMGCSVHKDETIKVTGSAELKGIKVNMTDMPDTAQTLSVVAAFAKGDTYITGLNTLEHKETERLSAVQTELFRMGIESRIDNNSILIKGGCLPDGARISTYGDHRMAMAFAAAGIRIGGISLESPDVVKKSFPGFWDTLKYMGIKVELK